MDDTNILGQSSQSSNPIKTSRQYSPDEIIDIDILELMGVKDMAQDQKDAIYKKMAETIERRVVAKIEDKLSDEDMVKVEAAIGNNDQNAFMQVFIDKGISIEKIYAEETLLYKFEMVQLMNNSTKE